MEVITQFAVVTPAKNKADSKMTVGYQDNMYSYIHIQVLILCTFLSHLTQNNNVN